MLDWKDPEPGGEVANVPGLTIPVTAMGLTTDCRSIESKQSNLQPAVKVAFCYLQFLKVFPSHSCETKVKMSIISLTERVGRTEMAEMKLIKCSTDFPKSALYAIHWDMSIFGGTQAA